MGTLEEWERASRNEERPGFVQHGRGGTLTLSNPGARVIELTQQLERTRVYLSEAVAEVRRLSDRSVPDDRFHTMRGVSFGGVACAQIWADFILWEAVLNENPQLRGIVEIGTWKGGFSLWLRAQAEVRDMTFVTYDAVEPDQKIPGFVRRDVFADPYRMATTIRRTEPVILFCDGGNKPRELATFPKFFVDPGSLVVVHDWGTETLPTDVPDDLEPAYEEFCEEIGSISRVFRVRR